LYDVVSLTPPINLAFEVLQTPQVQKYQYSYDYTKVLHNSIVKGGQMSSPATLSTPKTTVRVSDISEGDIHVVATARQLDNAIKMCC
jgi:hypothetical protein